MENPAYVISADSHSAALFRQTVQTQMVGTGVVGSGDLAVTQNGTANMSVNVAPGMVWLPGTLGATSGFGTNVNAQTSYGLPSGLTSQGSYCAYQDATVNLAISTADPANPRIDLIVASIQDAQYAGTNNTPVLQVITGTPNPSPSAPSAPASTVVLAQVAVAANATSITSGNITDKRPFYTPRGVNLASGSVPLLVKYYTGSASLGTAWDGVSPLIVQDFSAVVSVSSANFTLNFPIAFPNGLLNLTVTAGDGASGAYNQINPIMAGGSPNTTLSTISGQAWSKAGAAYTGSARINVHAVGW